jgi:ATP-dependent DNA ligase
VEVDLDSIEGNAALQEFSHQALIDGYGGIMIKDPVAPYVGKRTAAWLKRDFVRKNFESNIE